MAYQNWFLLKLDPSGDILWNRSFLDLTLAGPTPWALAVADTGHGGKVTVKKSLQRAIRKP